jgi:cytochrome c-type biogenesis protein CcmH
MLGWSYLHTQRYAEAVKAYTTALALDPQDADIRSALEEARTKAATSTSPTNGQLPGETAPGGESDSEPRSDEFARSPMVKGMVDRLASRLDSSPNDAEGWLKLMRARTVLGEMELAHEALRRALAAFAEDKSTRERIMSAARDMGLSAY